jgi:hypothetical protein
MIEFARLIQVLMALSVVITDWLEFKGGVDRKTYDTTDLIPIVRRAVNQFVEEHRALMIELKQLQQQYNMLQIEVSKLKIENLKPKVCNQVEVSDIVRKGEFDLREDCKAWIKGHVFDGEFTTLAQASKKFGYSALRVKTMKREVLVEMGLGDWIDSSLHTIQWYLQMQKRIDAINKEYGYEEKKKEFTYGLGGVIREDKERSVMAGGCRAVPKCPSLDELDRR